MSLCRPRVLAHRSDVNDIESELIDEALSEFR